MALYNIAFDMNNKTEWLNHYSIEKKKGFVFESVNKCTIRPICSFLLEFINMDIDNEIDEINFMAKYCLEDLLIKVSKNSKTDISKFYKKNKFYITSKSLYDLFPKLESIFDEDFEYYQYLFIDFLTGAYNATPVEFDRLSSERRVTFLDSNPEEEYYDNLSLLNHRIDDLKLDFAMDDFYYFHKDLNLPKHVPYSFQTNDYLNLLFISYKNILSLDSNIKIKKCANCNKYFIPKTMHDTKYCDEIFKDNKTCKEIGRELAYKESLAKEPLLKAYRSRYQTLSKQASEREKHEMYEYFKKEGPAMRKKFINGEINSNEFQNWINSTKIRKK